MSKLRRCPKCRSAALVVYEIAQLALPLEQTTSGAWRRIFSTPEPEVHHCEARCRACGHEWTLRGTVYCPGERLADGENEMSDPAIPVKRNP